MKLWSGRLPGAMDPLAAQLNNSLSFDKRLAQVDVRASLAWARALEKAHILSSEEAKTILSGLTQIQGEFGREVFTFLESDEDIHTAVERRLIELVGLVGGKLHTGRSRNDQVATDLRLWLLDTIHPIQEALTGLRKMLINRAEEDWGIALPGYTHYQQAQPILFSHWWLSHFWALQRDFERLNEIYRHTLVSPLGSGALAGTTFPIDRLSLAQDLGLEIASQNSLDAVSDRDFAVEFIFWASLSGVHLSRLAEALILYSTREFGYITLADEYSTGSSLMPQKKNPDPLELTRAKSSLLISRLNELLNLLKGLPSAYDKDMQEDKPAVFETADTIYLLIRMMTGLIETLIINGDRCRAAMNWQLMATDLADYLVKKGIPFREAHSDVGKLIRQAEVEGVDLPNLPITIWQSINPIFQADIFTFFNIERSLDQHAVWGGTAPSAVKEQITLAKSLVKKS